MKFSAADNANNKLNPEKLIYIYIYILRTHDRTCVCRCGIVCIFIMKNRNVTIFHFLKGPSTFLITAWRWSGRGQPTFSPIYPQGRSTFIFDDGSPWLFLGLYFANHHCPPTKYLFLQPSYPCGFLLTLFASTPRLHVGI